MLAPLPETRARSLSPTGLPDVTSDLALCINCHSAPTWKRLSRRIARHIHNGADIPLVGFASRYDNVCIVPLRASPYETSLAMTAIRLLQPNLDRGR